MSHAVSPSPALELRGISMSFGDVAVLRDVDLVVRPGEIHAVVGHNGAGKSTLMHVASGVYSPTAGEVHIGGTRLERADAGLARALGLGMVHQERSLIDTLSGLDNIFLNVELKNRLRLIRRADERADAERLCARLGVGAEVLAQKAGELSPVNSQMVEIVKATRSASSVLILDEPTAPLNHGEIDALFSVVRNLAAVGMGAVLITHHLNEVFEVCDQVTVLRDGAVAASGATSQFDVPQIIDAMLGGEGVAPLSRDESESTREPGPVLFEARQLSVAGKLQRGVSLQVRQGEIVGLAGLAGSGRSTLLRAMFGDGRLTDGGMTLGGEDYAPRGPHEAIGRGVFLVPEDRKVRGLHLTKPIGENVTLPVLKKLRRGIFLDKAKGTRRAAELTKRLRLVARGMGQPAGELSGGNQQKVVLAKALATEARLLLLDEPTLGVDIGAAGELITHIRKAADTGAAVIWNASDLQELLEVADRIVVLADGGVRAELRPDEDGWTESNLINSMQRRQSATTQEKGLIA